MGNVIGSLNVMYNIERAATAIYKAQAGAFRGNAAVYKTFKAATANEQEHADGLKARVAELKGRGSFMGWFFALGGMMIGVVSRIMGKKRVMKTNIWVEKKAVKDYGAFLEKVNFDETSAALIRKNIGDEQRHVDNWTRILGELNK
ncbi:MAG: demethoxyubiquinone hydroxylase family protein [Dehalococcoidia bacterium]|jgi:demethoxyubiquinone hydroxylase (CLK1/Coq7/Cat5 family)